MKDQTYRPDFEVTPKRERFAVTRRDADRVTCTPERDILTRSSRTIGDVAYALLMITIVGAHPIWVMWLLVLVYSR